MEVAFLDRWGTEYDAAISVATPPEATIPKRNPIAFFEDDMLKRFIALAIAITALSLAAAYYGVSAVTPNVLMSSVTDVDSAISNGVTNGRSVQFAGNLTQARNPQTLVDDDYIAYRHVFAHIYSEEHGKEKPNHGVNPVVESFKHSVPLSEDEAKVLAKTALETETRTLAIEAQAAAIIRRFRQKIDAEMKSGRKASPEPPELRTLQETCVKTTLQGRDELRKAFGDSTFSRFDTFLKEGMNLRIEKAIPSR